MTSVEELQKPVMGSSGASDGEGSADGSAAGPDSPECPDKALEEEELVAERKSEEAAVEEPQATAVTPSHSPRGCSEGVVESEEEGAVHSPESSPHLHLTKDISEDALEAAPAVPVAKKCLNSRSMEPLEGELDFEDDAPPESPSGTPLHSDAPDTKEGKTKEDNLEEGEAEDDGEVSDVSGTELSVQDDDLEEGELPEGTGATGATRKTIQTARPICRFFNKGQCTWGSSCRFIHPGINDRGNYNMFATVPKPLHHHMPPPMGGPSAVMRGGAPPPEFLGPPMPPLQPPPEELMLPPVESAWERGLRHAKELMKRASRRKEQEPDFEEKRLNLVPSHHDRAPLQSEGDKENDFYGGSSVPASRVMSPPYVRPPMPPPPSHHPGRGGRRSDGRRDDFYGFEEPDTLEHSEREAREYWRGGRYENFEVRWSNRQEFDHRDRREKDRRVGRSYDREKSGYSHGVRSDRSHGGGPEREPRWREERFSEAPPPPMARQRPDEWRDPWRRSKTPKGRRSRSRGRNRRSFSNCSSRSFSSRSSRSSYSYSRSSSSRSSYSSYDSRSRSRSPARAAPSGRPRGGQPPSRGPPLYGPPSQAPGKQGSAASGGGTSGGNSGGTGGGRSPVLDRRKQYNPSPPPITTPASPPRKSRRKAPSPPLSKQKKSRSGGSFSASSSRSRSRSSSSRTPSRSRSRSYSRSPSLNSVSSASSSPRRRRLQAPSAAAAMLAARNPSPPKKGPEGSKKRMEKDPLPKGASKLPVPPQAAPALIPTMIPSFRDLLPPPLDLAGFEEEVAQRQAREAALRQQSMCQKPQIKLTLIKKQLPLALAKKEEPPAKNNGDKAAKKRPASPKLASSPSPPPGGRKSTTLRREELLKQLKAVEDAIARKRAKFS
uniref:Putative pha03307 transcriptional regulator icp4 n=1 Tax=Amblyomma triste TaxID=251400 RepID=A0A023GDD4_AMBTT